MGGRGHLLSPSTRGALGGWSWGENAMKLRSDGTGSSPHDGGGGGGLAGKDTSETEARACGGVDSTSSSRTARPGKGLRWLIQTQTTPLDSTLEAELPL